MCVTLDIQHAKRFMLSILACLTLPYFYILYHKRHDFQAKVIEHNMCFDFLYKFI
jgi:hypothetical protein